MTTTTSIHSPWPAPVLAEAVEAPRAEVDLRGAGLRRDAEATIAEIMALPGLKRGLRVQELQTARTVLKLVDKGKVNKALNKVGIVGRAWGVTVYADGTARTLTKTRSRLLYVRTEDDSRKKPLSGRLGAAALTGGLSLLTSESKGRLTVTITTADWTIFDTVNSPTSVHRRDAAKLEGLAARAGADHR